MLSTGSFAGKAFSRAASYLGCKLDAAFHAALLLKIHAQDAVEVERQLNAELSLRASLRPFLLSPDQHRFIAHLIGVHPLPSPDQRSACQLIILRRRSNEHRAVRAVSEWK